MFTSIEKALEHLKTGKSIIVVDDEDRENEGDLLALAEFATGESINFMASVGRGLICAPVSADIAAKLDLHPMVSSNSDPHGTAFTVSIDHRDSTTGISAFERAHTIRQLVSDNASAADFQRPGHVFPLIAQTHGVLERAGHTEAAVDLARLAGAKPAGVICEIMNADGTMARLPELEKIAAEYELPIISIQDLIRYRKRHDKLIEKQAEIQLPTDIGDFRLVNYLELTTGLEHLAIIKGEPAGEAAPLVRVHSECLTGDVFGSQRCDCGPQLRYALEQMEAAGTGVLLYLRQEGRGIGLLNKLKAYQLQEQGFDTVEANHQLGFPSDLREYYIAAQMLEDLNVQEIKLLTNNPDKLAALEEYGITIKERVAVEMTSSQHNENYLKTKQTKLGHMLSKL